MPDALEAGDARAAFVLDALVATRTLTTTGIAQQVAPNALSLTHWDRLLDGEVYASSTRLDWRTLLKRTFDIDLRAFDESGFVVGNGTTSSPNDGSTCHRSSTGGSGGGGGCPGQTAKPGTGGGASLGVVVFGGDVHIERSRIETSAAGRAGRGYFGGNGGSPERAVSRRRSLARAATADAEGRRGSADTALPALPSRSLSRGRSPRSTRSISRRPPAEPDGPSRRRWTARA